ncbi:MAG: hypothetical protein LBI67_09435 [Treponema sp.]|nr:hypothetical protein [Treponema sp.]
MLFFFILSGGRSFWQTPPGGNFALFAEDTRVSSADPRAEIPSETVLRRLVYRPEAIYTDVGSYKEGDDTWITLEADVHVCTEISLARVKAVLIDYGNYVNTFKRTTASRFVREVDGAAEVFLQVTVGALGITFVTNHSVLSTKEIDENDCFLVRFSHLSDDGVVRNVRGYWFLKTVYVRGKPFTYIRYYSAQDSLKKNALQKTATSMFIVSEYTGMLKELLDAAK